MKRLCSVLLIIFVIGVSSIVAPQSASAFSVTGCKNLSLSQGYSVHYIHSPTNAPTVWKTALSDASTAWWRAGVRGSFGPATSGNYSMVVQTANFVEGYLGQASWVCGWNGFHLAGYNLYVRFNLRTTGSMSAWQRRYIAVHELGHIIGVDHTPWGCGVSIMKSNSNVQDPACANLTPPWSDDIKGYHYLYG